MKLKIFRWTVIVICFYIIVAHTVYRYNHPELTETQLTLNFWEAMTWQK